MFRLPRGVGNKQSAIWKKMADAVLMNSNRHDLKERELWRRKMKEN
jgi:hypothetical protein